jgi:hypothetical protein
MEYLIGWFLFKGLTLEMIYLNVSVNVFGLFYLLSMNLIHTYYFNVTYGECLFNIMAD